MPQDTTAADENIKDRLHDVCSLNEMDKSLFIPEAVMMESKHHRAK